MKPSEEQRLGKMIVAAQERLRQCICRNGTATQWHLEKAASVVRKPKLLERFAPHLEGEPAKLYLAELAGWIEQTKQQDARCAELWTKKRADHAAQREHLVAMLLRYDFSLRLYEKLARQPSLQLASADASPSAETTYDETTSRMTEQEFSELQSRIESDLQLLDKTRAELVAGHDDLVAKLVQKSIEKSAESAEEVTAYARSGLTKAAENYDVRAGHRFSTYAQWWIKTAIKEKKSWEK
jgi:DNA-directed RNA polymerase sigma subunit (sigma70/sigma32)